MLSLPDHWLWDFWLVDDGTSYHLFFLKAPRSVDPALRHWNLTVGHAVSSDLTTWQVLDDALRPSADPAFDDYATWTGSVVLDDDGLWQMFYTGLSRADRGQVQRVGVATSPDLRTWTKQGPQALVTSDARWYEQFAATGRPEAWRDPWVMRDPDGDGWHMILTATARPSDATGARGSDRAAGTDSDRAAGTDSDPVAGTDADDDRGVLGHARSSDLVAWEVQPPLSQPGAGFTQLEVPQVVVVDGEPLLLFSCLGPELSSARRVAGQRGGVWMLRPERLLGPYDVARAVRVTDESLYVGKVVQDRSGSWRFLAFLNTDSTGAFVGTLSDPLELPWAPGVLGRGPTPQAG